MLQSFNNKNIKHAANPKEGGNEDTVESELQNERNSKRTNGISFWYGQGNMVRSVKRGAAQQIRQNGSIWSMYLGSERARKAAHIT